MARRLIGTVTIVGMVFSSAFAIFLVPMLFVIVERIARRGRGGDSHRTRRRIRSGPNETAPGAERAAGGG